MATSKNKRLRKLAPRAEKWKSEVKQLLILMLLASPVMAQTRVLVGAEAGSSFGNLYAGPVVAIEIPVHRFELDLKDSFAPIEEHVDLGTGWANRVQGGWIVWVMKSLGVNANAEYSNYKTQISKHAEYAASGIVLRKSVDFMPMRFTFNYVWEFNNGIDATGTESGHLKAGDFNLDMRVACHLNFCIRTQFDSKIGVVLTQSNPVCDGSYGGRITCARDSASSGAFSVAVLFEWPRRRAAEEEAF